MKLAQPHDVSVQTVHTTLHKDVQLNGVGQVSNQNALRRDEEGAIDNVQGSHGHGYRGFLTNHLGQHSS